MKNSEPFDIIITPHKDYIAQTRLFQDKYDLVDVVFAFGGSNASLLKKKSERKCRFCNGAIPATTFDHNSHLISKFLGNKTLLSDFECDKCNSYFSKFETDLSYFLGISRSIIEPTGEQKIPTFKSADKTVEIRGKKIEDEHIIVISRDDAGNQKITLDCVSGKGTITVIRHSFVPLSVYKAFVKMALSILKEKEVQDNYKVALDWLMQRNKEKLSGCLLTGYCLPLNFNLPPHVFVFKKKTANDKMHSHLIAFYFGNMIIALPMPLNQQDFSWYDQSISLTLYPPLFTQFTNTDRLRLETFEEDFSSEMIVKGTEQQIYFEVDPEELKNTVAFNGNTGELSETKFEPGEIMKLVITKSGAGFEHPSQIYNAVK